MNKKFLIISLIIISIIIIIFTNKYISTVPLEDNFAINDTNIISNSLDTDTSKTPKDLESLNDIPIPDSIIFYYNGIKKEFNGGTNEFNEIIKLNNKRDSGTLGTGALKLAVDVKYLLKNETMLEYKYKKYNSVYFTLISDEELEKDSTKTNWVSIGYDSNVFKQFIYSGLTSSDNLINYLKTLK